MEKTKQEGYFYIIPANLVDYKKPRKALLFGLLASLCNQKGYCWASTEFLAAKLQVKSKKTIYYLLNELEKDGWIKRTTEKNYERKIYVNFSPNFPIDEEKHEENHEDNEDNIVVMKKREEEKKETKKYEKEENQLLEIIKLHTGRRFRILDAKAKRQLHKLLDEGVTIKEIEDAVIGASNDEFHQKTKYKYLTPEFITREDKFNFFHNAFQVEKLEKKYKKAENFSNEFLNDFAKNFTL